MSTPKAGPQPARPKMIDFFAGAGGCAVGYHRAGFDVTCVDIKAHPDNPFELIVADAMELANDPEFMAGFDAAHGSPPCPRYSTMTPAHTRDSHPDLVGPFRDAMHRWGSTYVIENVPGAPLHSPALLCGSIFGLRVRRHRLFESNVFMLTPPCNHQAQGTPVGVYGDHGDARTLPTPRHGHLAGREGARCR